MKPALLLALAFSLASSLSTGAQAEEGYFDKQGHARPCDVPSVTQTLVRRFDDKVRTFLNSDVEIERISHIKETRFEDRDSTHRVQRRYCVAQAEFTNGDKRKIWYLLENTWGGAGIGGSIEFCIAGMDPWHNYGASCRSLQ